MHAAFVFQSKNRHFVGGSQQWKILSTSLVTFEIEVANFENYIAPEKRPQNQNALIRIDDLGVILLEKEFHVQQCTQLVYFAPHFLEIIDCRCCILSGPPCNST